MKAVQYDRFGGPEVLQYLDVADPRPGAGEVLIETAAIGGNFPDIRERLGIYKALCAVVDADADLTLLAGLITSKVDTVLPLAAAAEAHRRLENRTVRGVIVLDPKLEAGAHA